MDDAKVTPADATSETRGLAEGDSRIADRLFPIVYDELRDLASRYVRRARPGDTMRPTALVHEAYLRLVHQPGAPVEGRAHFFAVAALAMRQHLANYARDRHAAKRGPGWGRVTLSVIAGTRDRLDVDALTLHEALDKLTALNERHAQVVTLRFLGGLTVEETAEALGISPRSVKSDWRVARAWLARELRSE